MKGLFRSLLFVALAIVGLSLIAAPLVAFQGIRSAADAQDIASLQRLIDFAAVRQGLRPQMAGSETVQAPPPSLLEDPLGAIRRQFRDAAPLSPRPDPDIYLTPNAISALTRGAGRRAATGARPERDPAPRPIYWGVNDVRLAVGSDGDRTVFGFRRRGPFTWVLTHIGLPPETVVRAPQ